MNDKDFTITDLALIFEKEKKSKALTKIRKDFYQVATQCIQSMRERYQKELAANPDSRTTEMARRELERARKDLENIVHMRTTKILKQSHDHYFKYDNDFLSALTEEEKRFLEGIMAVIAQFVANAWLWDKSNQPPHLAPPTTPKPTEKLELEKPQIKPIPMPEKLPEITELEKKNFVIIFLTESSIALPEQNLFYKKGDIASLPEKIAKVLVKEKKATLIYPM
ncbi:MAG: hypothetical protein QW620_01560 [Thermoplasmata archaeon]